MKDQTLIFLTPCQMLWNKNMYEVPCLCHLLDDFLSENQKLLKIVLHIFNVQGIPLSKNNIIGPSSRAEGSSCRIFFS